MSGKKRKAEAAAEGDRGRPIQLQNKQLLEELERGEIMYLYHLGLDTTMDLKGMFRDTRFVIMGGSPARAEHMAELARTTLGFANAGGGFVPQSYIGKQDRFNLFKVGPIVCVSHGMGMPSMSICLHEMAKLLYVADARDVIFIRVGTSGGVGVEPGTVIVADGCVNGLLEQKYYLPVLGVLNSHEEHPTVLDKDLAKDIVACNKSVVKGFKMVHGLTMGTDCFYEGQSRLDGAFCDYTSADKMAFLQKASDAGVKNIEMEGPYFAYFCNRLGIRGAIVCCALLNRLDGDQISSTGKQLGQFADNALDVVFNFIAHTLDVPRIHPQE